MQRDELNKHVLSNYLTLSLGLGILSFALPPLVWAGGWFLDSQPLLSSISVYYHTVMRNVFVGILFAIGTFLYLYKGVTTAENLALNLAGIFAIAVALIPTAIPIELLTHGAVVEGNCGINSGVFQCKSVHGVVAVALFLCIGYVCIFRAKDTLKFINNSQREKIYTLAYKYLGIALLIIPAATACYVQFIQSKDDGHSIAVFVFELLAVWIFAAYWILKRIELKQSLNQSVFPKSLNKQI